MQSRSRSDTLTSSFERWKGNVKKKIRILRRVGIGFWVLYFRVVFIFQGRRRVKKSKQKIRGDFEVRYNKKKKLGVKSVVIVIDVECPAPHNVLLAPCWIVSFVYDWHTCRQLSHRVISVPLSILFLFLLYSIISLVDDDRGDNPAIPTKIRTSCN